MNGGSYPECLFIYLTLSCFHLINICKLLLISFIVSYLRAIVLFWLIKMKINDLNISGSPKQGEFVSASQNGGMVTLAPASRWSTLRYFKYEKTPRHIFEDMLSKKASGREAYENAGRYFEEALKYLDSDKPIRPDLLLKLHKSIEQAIQSEPNFPGAYLLRGAVHSMTGNFSGAIKDFTYAINLNPYFSDRHFDVGDGYVGRGYAYYFMGNIEKAYDDWERAAAMGNAEAKEIIKNGP